jgi:hypothetical protein
LVGNKVDEKDKRKINAEEGEELGFILNFFHQNANLIFIKLAN